MASKDIPLSELLMQEPDPIVDLLSPLNSVDDSSKDRIQVQEELEKRLKQRAGRQDLVERNILPPLSFPTAPKLFTNSQQLQRAQIADNLTKKMRNRPARDNLMQMNILPDLQSNIDPALQATQLQLRKSKLADTLNDKLANRPGPLQLLQNGIIEPQLSEVVKGYELEEAIPSIETPISTSSSIDAAMSLIPEISLQQSASISTSTASSSSAVRHPALQQRHSFAGMSPSADMFGMDISPSPSEGVRKVSDSSLSPAPSPEGVGSPEKSPRCFNSSYPPVLQTSQSMGVLHTASGKSYNSPNMSSRKNKSSKKYRKLRYHEYVPPSKSTPKGGKTTPKPPAKSDSPYSAILQQQQLFLQLQVLQQQYPNGILMQKLPEMISTMSKDQKALAIAAAKGRISVTSPSDMNVSSKQATLPQVLPVATPNKHNTSSVRFEDLKVNDLKAACKENGMIVSGKKAELVERLMDHCKGVLPASALPENLSKDSKRQTFTLAHGSSIDSQFSTSSTASPTSPNPSPIFKFPADRSGGHDVKRGGVPLPEGIPTANLHKELNKMFERQKRDYISLGPKGVAEKSIAPRPELAELLAKLPSYPTSANEQQPRGGKGSTLPGNGRMADSRVQALGAERGKASSRSLPASPKPGSPAVLGSDMMDSSCTPEEQSRLPSLSIASQVYSNPTSNSGGNAGMNHVHGGLGSIPASVSILNQSTSAGQIAEANLHSVSAGGNTYTTPFYQQQQQTTALHQAKRPDRSSVPTQTPSGLPQGGQHVGGPPSYTSVMRSRSIAGTHPSMSGLAALQSRMNNGGNFGPDLTGMGTPPNEMTGFVNDSVDMAMDTGESSISDIFDILTAEGEDFEHPSHPISLLSLSGGGHAHSSRRTAHSSLPQTPQYGTATTKLGANVPQDAGQPNYMLGNIMPFGNPSFTAQNKSGSDICLNVPDGSREGQKNSTGGSGGVTYPAGGTNLTLGNDLSWLDLDNTGGLGLSPTLHSTNFGSLNTHSNPGSLPHEQFQTVFLDEGMSAQVGMMDSLTKNSNPAMNGFGVAPAGVAGEGIAPFLDPAMIHQPGMYGSSEEQQLVELGLSR